MTSTYSTNLRIELIGSGDQSSTWGTTTNTNLGTLLEQAISGVSSVVFSADSDKTLTTVNGNTDEARQMIISLTSTVSGGLTATRNVIIPSVNKMYIVKNGTSGGQSIVVKTSAGTGITITNGETTMVWCNGTNVYSALDYVPALVIGSGGLNLQGNFAVGASAPTDNVAVRIQPTIVSTTSSQYGVYADTTFSESGTNQYGFHSTPNGSAGTGSTAYTTTSVRNFSAGTYTKSGTNQTITNLYSFYGASQTSGTNNYGLYLLNDAASALTITGINGNGSAVIVTTSAVHGLTTGDKVIIANVPNATMTTGTYNGGPYVITVTSTTIFTYSSSALSSATVTSGNAVKANNWNVYANGSENNWFGGPVLTSVNSTLPAFRITQTGTGDAFVVEDSTNPDVTPFSIDASGTVITYNSILRGYDTATATKNYGNTAVTPSIQSHGTDQSTGTLGIFQWSATASSPPGLLFSRSKGAAAGTRGVVAADDDLGQIVFNGDNGTNFLPAAAIISEVDAAISGTTDMPGRLSFWTTADGGVAPSERMRIGNGGEVVIGSTTIVAGQAFRVGTQPATTTSYGMYINGQIQSGVTTVYGVRSDFPLAATAAVTNLYNFGATQGTVTSGATITNQYGFFSSSALIEATTNYAFSAKDTSAIVATKTAYGFHSDIDIATGGGTTWGFYANGTAPNYFAGTIARGYSTAVAVQNITGAAVTPAIQSHGTGANNAGLGLYSWASAVTSPASLTFSKAKSGTIGTFTTALASGEDLGQINFNGSDGTKFITGASILAEADSAAASNTMPGRLSFFTTPNTASATPIERMRIDSSGYMQGTVNGLGEGRIPAMQYYRVHTGVTGTVATTAQSVLGVGVALIGSMQYEFEAFYYISKSVGTTSHTIGFGFGGTATINNILYEVIGFEGSTALPTVSTSIRMSSSSSVANLVWSSSISSAAQTNIVTIKGTVSIATGGSFIPQYTLSASPGTGGTYTTQPGSYFSIWPLAASGATVNIGTWA